MGHSSVLQDLMVQPFCVCPIQWEPLVYPLAHRSKFFVSSVSTLISLSSLFTHFPPIVLHEHDRTFSLIKYVITMAKDDSASELLGERYPNNINLSIPLPSLLGSWSSPMMKSIQVRLRVLFALVDDLRSSLRFLKYSSSLF